MSRSEAAKFLGYSMQTLANLAILQKGPRFYSSGKKLWYFRSDLLVWVRSQQQLGRSAA
jgi:hypothetical protein